MDKLGWKLGERITIVGDIFPVNLEMKLVGILTIRKKGMFFFTTTSTCRRV